MYCISKKSCIFVESKAINPRHNNKMTTKNFTFSEGFLTLNDKKALVSSLYQKDIKGSEKRVILHGKTRLTLECSKKNGYKVGKAVDGGSTYQYSSYFTKK